MLEYAAVVALVAALFTVVITQGPWQRPSQELGAAVDRALDPPGAGHGGESDGGPGLDPLAAAALPVGLLCVGAGLQRIALRTHAVGLAVASVAKLIILPGLTLVALVGLGVSGPVALIALVFCSIGTASTAYVLARQLGGDASLMAALIAFQTVASFVTLPLVLSVGAAVLL